MTSNDMSKLLTVNKLKYQLPSNLNIVERRQNKVSFADQNSYLSQAGSEVVIRFTASTDYVYGPNSFLTFDIKTEATGSTGEIGFENETAMSLFSRVLYEDRSGSELERNDRLNAYCAQVGPWKYTKNAVTPAMAGKYLGDEKATRTDPATFGSHGSLANYDTTTGKLSVVVPLRHFLGIYNRETLVPSMLVSGSLLRLQLAPALDALSIIGVGDKVPESYTISNPRVVLDSMSLAPVVQKNLMEQTQNSGGLDFSYTTAYYQSGNPGSNPAFNLQINKAVSRCSKLFWSSRATSTETKVSNSNHGTEQLAVNKLDYRLGDLYFPQRVINVIGTSQKNGSELYQNSLQSMNRMRTDENAPWITKNIFCCSGVPLDATPANNDNKGYATHVQSFEMSSALEYSGLAINNSRTLEARIGFTTPVVGDRTIDAWVEYVKLAKCNQLRCILKE